MSKKDGKNIPILDDVIRTGDTDKAVKGGINPYPRKLTSRKKKISVSADAKTSKDNLTDAYEKIVTKKKVAKNDKKPGDKASNKTSTVKHKPDASKTGKKKNAKSGTDKSQQLNLELEPIIEIIVQEMMPDIEQHIRLQLRFELEKHLPNSVINLHDQRFPEPKDKDTDK